MKPSGLFACAAIALFGACGTPAPEHFYFLDLPERAPADVAPIGDFAGTIVLNVAAIPESVDRSELVVETGPNQLALLDFDRWAGPLRGNIAQVLAASLARAMPKAAVAMEGTVPERDAVRVVVRIDALRHTYDGRTLLEAQWTVIPPHDAPATTHHANIVRAEGTQAPVQLVKSWSEELDELGRRIAGSIAR